MRKKITFIISFYVFNIITYFFIWRTIVLKSYDKVSKKPETLNEFEKNGLTIESMKISFLKNDVQIFNPFFQIGFYFSTWMFIPSLLMTFILVYFIFKRKKNIPSNLDVLE